MATTLVWGGKWFCSSGWWPLTWSASVCNRGGGAQARKRTQACSIRSYLQSPAPGGSASMPSCQPPGEVEKLRERLALSVVYALLKTGYLGIHFDNSVFSHVVVESLNATRRGIGRCWSTRRRGLSKAIDKLA